MHGTGEWMEASNDSLDVEWAEWDSLLVRRGREDRV